MENKGEYFSLKWRDFRSSFSGGFHDFLQEEAMVDVTLAAEGKFVQAHKLVLSVCSPYFKNLFKVNPCKHPIVILKDVRLCDLSYMLDFMYKGEVGVKHEDLQPFLKLAETLKIKGLPGDNFEKNMNFSAKKLNSNLARVRKKKSRDSVSEVNKENTEFQSCSEQFSKKVIKNRKRRLSCKSRSIKKLKSEKCEDGSVGSLAKNSGNLSEDEDNNPLIRCIGDHNEKSGESSKQCESQCDNESESLCDNKTSFSAWSDEVPDSDDSRGPDINSLFQSDHSEEPDETPQDNFSWLSLFSHSKRTNPVWDYFQLEGDKAICKLCRKKLAYKNHMYLTSLSNHLASKRYGHHKHYLEYVSKKSDIFKETDFLNNALLRVGKRFSGPADLSVLRHNLQ